MTKVAIALGGNIGNVEDAFNKALEFLQSGGFTVMRISSILSNSAVGCIEGTPDFKNAALIGNWTKTVEELLSLSQSIETTLGRPKEHQSNQSRVIDLDIILFGNQIIRIEGLTVPHSRAQSREFVLIPLNQIAPDWIFPDTQRTVTKALNMLNLH